MAVNFAQTDPLDLALKKTFDGKHPCRICKTVEEGRKSDQKQPTLKVEHKLELCLSREAATLPAPALLAMHLTQFSDSHFSRSEAPPTPPPRLA